MNLDVIVNGVEYSLDDGAYCQHLGHNGVGMMPSHRLTQRGPMQHGTTDLGFRGDPRTVQLALLIEGTSMSNYWTRRTALMNLFKPTNDALKLRFTLDNDDVRQLDCQFIGDMSMGSQEKMRYTHAVGVTLQAANPAFYDPTSKTTIFALGGGSAAFDIPMAIPLDVGVSTLNQAVTIDYDGSWLTYPYRIRITGPITDACITNLATSEKLDFDGYTISAGHYYDIDCRYAEKTVEDDSTPSVNKISELTNDSDLVTWHLAAHPDVVDGQNSIRVAGTSVTAATEVTIQWFDQFVGI